MLTARRSVPPALGVVLALAGPALAESPQEVPAQADYGTSFPAFFSGGEWSGPYVGLQFGYAEADSNQGDDSSWAAGVLGGYRWDRGAAVFGVEVDYLQPDLRIKGENVDYLVRFKGQLGYDFGRTLAYGTAGLSSPDTLIGDETGWLIGAGIDYAVSPSFLLGAELIYQEFDEFGNAGFSADSTTAGLRASFRF